MPIETSPLSKVFQGVADNYGICVGIRPDQGDLYTASGSSLAKCLAPTRRFGQEEFVREVMTVAGFSGTRRSARTRCARTRLPDPRKITNQR